MAKRIVLTNLALSDILMTGYMLGIGIVNEQYREKYVLMEYVWRNSIECTIIGFLGVLSTELSLITIVFWVLIYTYIITYSKGIVSVSLIKAVIICVFGWQWLQLLPYH